MATEQQKIDSAKKPGGKKYIVQKDFMAPGRFTIRQGYLITECNDGFYCVQRKETIDEPMFIRLGPEFIALNQDNLKPVP